MNRIIFWTVFTLGLLAVAWVGAGFEGSNGIALGMTCAIAAAYLLGTFELARLRADTASLVQALAEVPGPLTGIDDWLQRLPVSLRQWVRLRIKGERTAPPGPALTPYLVSLLVMLGMLGTFLGLILTFRGTVFALEGSADLQAIRSALAAPIKGLGLAFGSSVAGVAASAALGLMSSLSRRDRMQATGRLELSIETVFRSLSRAHQRQATLGALQIQAQALPAIVERLQAMTEGLEHRSQQLDERLLERQEGFHREVTIAYTALAQSVGESLQERLAAGVRIAGDSVRPIVQAAMQGIAQESTLMHQRQVDMTQAQLQNLAAKLTASAQTASTAWAEALREHAGSNARMVGDLDRALASFTETFEGHTDALLSKVDAAVSRAQADQAAGEQQRLQAWTRTLEQTAGEITRHASEQAGQTLAGLERLSASAEALIGSRLDSEAAWIQQNADRMGQLAGLLQEFSRLLQGLQQTTGQQQAAIESLAGSTATLLEQAGSRFSEAIKVQADKAVQTATHLNGSAIELSSLGESFSHGVQLFSAANEKLLESLQRIEDSIARSMTRSDQQLAYYVAQAREVIDLSITSQQGIIEDLRRLHERPPASAGARA